GSALAKLWGMLADQVGEPMAGATPALNANAATPPPLRRFPADFAIPALPATASVPTRPLLAVDASAVAFEWAHATAAAIGTVTHRAVMRFAADGIAQWNDERVAALGPRIRRALRSGGV